MSALNTQRTIGEMVAEKPNRSKFFETLGVDYCCGGKKTLEEVCLAKGLDSQSILGELMVFDQQKNDSTGPDLRHAPLNDVVDHILDVHHVYTKEALERLSRMVEKVARVHGDNHPELLEIKKVYTTMQTELLMHMEKEEMALFPYIHQLATAEEAPQFHCGSINNPVQVMTREHEETGAQLEALRQLTQDYTPPEDACNTYRAMYDGLVELEADLHQHIHKENNILFIRALQRVSELGSKSCV